ncbi:LAQU0S05e00782g1_1 [Lachancea quebecensis]|uniref:LAQU0S05e00782g1_1 n=1 Tax=Lachancea quebecensis TaxID=1654605 RepID=A0A0P1KRE0_9SACH|nr:LAQU0S05e00782g1_1 [Lachancea quebecensis]
MIVLAGSPPRAWPDLLVNHKSASVVARRTGLEHAQFLYLSFLFLFPVPPVSGSKSTLNFFHGARRTRRKCSNEKVEIYWGSKRGILMNRQGFDIVKISVVKAVGRELDFTIRTNEIGSLGVPFTSRIEHRRSKRTLERTYNSAEIEQGKFRAGHSERD